MRPSTTRRATSLPRDALVLGLRLWLRRVGPAPVAALGGLVVALALHLATVGDRHERGRLLAAPVPVPATGPGRAMAPASAPADALDGFLAVLGGPGDGVALSQAIWDEADRVGLRPQRLEFTDVPQAPGLFVRHEIRVPVEGSEAQVRRLAWTLLAAHPGLALDRLEWRRDEAGGPLLHAQLGFSFFTREGT